MYLFNKMNRFLPLVLVILVLLLSSCSERSEYGKKSDYEKFGAELTDSTAPTISSVSPTDNSTSKSPATTIAVTFSETISTSSITTNTNDTTCSGSFQLSSDNFTTCVKMSATPSASDNNMAFTATPKDNLSGGTTFKLRITTSAKDTSSNSLVNTYTTNGFTTSPSGSGTIKGSVKMDNGSAFSGITVSFSIYGSTVTTEETDSNGNFNKSSLGLGMYTLAYTETNYLTAIQSGTLATNNQTLVAATQTMLSDSCSGGNISGKIKDAVTGNALSNVTMSVRSGKNVRTGNTISGKTDTTDSNGAYTLSSMNPGSYTIQGSKDNWISTYFNVRSCSGRSSKNSNMSEELAPGSMRIVLSWEGTEDFDSHLEIPCTSGTCTGSNAADKSHLWYGVNQGGVSTNDYHNYTDIVNPGDNVTLDQDNTDGSASPCGSSCGPETITISKIRSGTYRYHVHAFDRAGDNTTHIADNGTVLQVFYNNDSINFDVPNTAGDLWTVFDFNISDGFNTLNTMSSEADEEKIDDH
ncbi:MAG: hypothetical protein HOC08_10155 [Deltaproteobacteria bacterium]|nr:hypothetical protein [Deltaproteobacteria bacterium]